MPMNDTAINPSTTLGAAIAGAVRALFTRPGLVTMALAGACATVAFDFFGQSLSPMLGFANLAPVPLANNVIQTLFGTAYRPGAEFLHYFAGMVAYPLGWMVLAHPIARALAPGLCGLHRLRFGAADRAEPLRELFERAALRRFDQREGKRVLARLMRLLRCFHRRARLAVAGKRAAFGLFQSGAAAAVLAMPGEGGGMAGEHVRDFAFAFGQRAQGRVGLAPVLRGLPALSGLPEGAFGLLCGAACLGGDPVLAGRILPGRFEVCEGMGKLLVERAGTGDGRGKRLRLRLALAQRRFGRFGFPGTGPGFISRLLMRLAGISEAFLSAG